MYPDDFSQDYNEEKSIFSFDDKNDDEPAFSPITETPENDPNDDLGVEKGFKTFTQLMDEDRKERSYMQKQSSSVNDSDDDDDLPNLSWINDI